MAKAFHFVTETRKAQVFSYGIRSLIELNIPEPAALFKRLLDIPFTLENPSDLDLTAPDCSAISTKNYKEMAASLGVTAEAPPSANPDLNLVVERTGPVNKGPHTLPFTVTVPAGYTAVNLHLSEIDIDENRKSQRSAWMHLGTGTVGWQKKKGAIIQSIDDHAINLPAGDYSADVTVNNLKSYMIRVVITMKGVQPDLTEWKENLCALLQDAYDKKREEIKLQKEAYDEAFSEHMAAQEELRRNKYNQHPFVMSQIIKEHLQQAAISYISCQFFDDNNAMKHRVKPCGFPQMDIREAKKEGEMVRFFEHAFEWKFMSYALYPTFWGRKCTWKDTAQDEGSSNHLFTKFLQAGNARISLSIRPGFEGLVQYFLENKKIWGETGIPPITGDGYLSIVQELKESKDNFNADRDGCVEWDGNDTAQSKLILSGNDDYYTEQLDANGDPTGVFEFDQAKADIDIDREITIECFTYRIADIEDQNGSLTVTLDRKLEVPCGKRTFEDIYQNRCLPWSTGALYVGAPWSYDLPTSLIWLGANSRCLPCYPIECEE